MSISTNEDLRDYYDALICPEYDNLNGNRHDHALYQSKLRAENERTEKKYKKRKDNC